MREHISGESKIAWKNDAPYVLCLTHDVDRMTKQWYHYIFYARHNPRWQIASLAEKIKGDEPYDNFRRIIDLEASYGAKSTFLFLNESHRELSASFMGRYDINSKRVQNVIQWIDKQGWEIGFHGSFYSYNNYELMKWEKDVLENIVGHSVVSTRQHYLNRDETTWQIQKKIGLKYDSTIGNKQTTGENFPAMPYLTEEGILEIPITVMDTVSMKNDTEVSKVQEVCRKVAEKGGVVMLNFHQRQLRETEYPFIVKAYQGLLQRAKEDGAWIATMGELGGWCVEKQEWKL